MGWLLLYQTTYLLALLAFLPVTLWQLVRYGKGRGSLLRRLWPVSLKLEGEGPLIWLHAVSVGEVKAVVALARELVALPSRPRLLVSTVTETGQEEACRALPWAEAHLYLPLDLGFCLRRALDGLSPSLVLMSETDLWYGFLRRCRSGGARVALVSGKISERSWRRWQRFAPFARRMLTLVDLFCVQSAQHGERFKALGAGEVRVTGNLKEAAPPFILSEEERRRWRARLGLKEGAPLLVIGCTHAPEEEALLPLLRRLIAVFPGLKVAIAPRHPERFRALAPLFDAALSEGEIGAAASLWLIDKMGQLPALYAIAELALLGGSLYPGVGGHNPLEPCRSFTPTLFGPHMEGQRALASAALESGAARCCRLEELEGTIAELLGDESARACMRAGCQRLLKGGDGPLESTLSALLQLVPELMEERQ